MRGERTIVWPFLLALLGGCPEEPSVDPHADEPWWVVADQIEAALLSVGGTSASDAWAVGADAGQGGLILRYDGQQWVRLASQQPYDLWWVHATSPSDVWIGGAGGTVLHYDGTQLVRQRTPGRAAHVVYGVWASGPADVWAVGGIASRYGFLWHFDGVAWTDIPLPDDIPLTPAGELPSLFKVWGRSPTDVYAVGGSGVMLHYDGLAWSVIPTETTETLLTVHGNEDRVVAVGGGEFGVILDGHGRSIGPAGAPTLQGVHVDEAGVVYATGLDRTVLRGIGDSWEVVAHGLDVPTPSLHAIWRDPDGGLWTVGGNVLTSALDQGVLFHRAPTAAGVIQAASPPAPVTPQCPADRIDLAPTASIARRWNELLLDSIRRDIPKPVVHARNLFHSSAAMYDAWATYDATADGYYYRIRTATTDIARDRDIAISYAVYRVLTHRYESANGGPVSLACYRAFMQHLGLDPEDTHTEGDDPIAVGNRIGTTIVSQCVNDGANEANNLADTTGYVPVNPPLYVARPGVGTLVDPNRWQELNLAEAETQNGIIVEAGLQKYIGPNWGHVAGFALPPNDGTGLRLPVPIVPDIADPRMKDWVVDVLVRTAALDHQDGELIDISPGAYGNNSLGENDGQGHPVNPVTGLPYAPNLVPHGDFARTLAEFWADGPKSETPPGHWNTLANSITDSPDLEHRIWGEGDLVDPLEWDVKMYFSLNAAEHDAGIAAWGVKRFYASTRPITLARYMGGKGQSSDPNLPSYDPGGLPLIDGVIELVTPQTAAPGQRHHHLRYWIGELAFYTWLGEPGDRSSEIGGMGWMRAVDWFPYQRRTFVTPAFPGLVSGHSTFSRAGAEVLTHFTGSPYFPGGLGVFTAQAGSYLVFEDGPSVDVQLQWGTYYDAADQAGQSRLYGGIHIWPDDTGGRVIGDRIGKDVAALARTYFDGTAHDG